MSADNWTICPLCEKERKEKKIKNIESVEEGYGILTKEEYLKAIRCSESENEEERTYTLREDYEIFTDDDGLFSVSYTCRCTKCRFTYSFSHKENLDV